MEALRLLERPKLTHDKKVLQQSTNSGDELERYSRQKIFRRNHRQNI